MEPIFSIEIITLVPQLWPALLSEKSGLVGKAFSQGLVKIEISHLRDFGKGNYKQVDDAPFGGGAGMVLMIEPLIAAIQRARARTPGPVILLSPRGKTFNHAQALTFCEKNALTLICGRFEGVDERVRKYVDIDLSIGDFVLSAGDPAAWCIIDAVVRRLPGVLGNPESLREESFSRDLLEYPHYTRPAEFAGDAVPQVLLSGDHQAITKWRHDQSLRITEESRHDLVDKNQRISR